MSRARRSYEWMDDALCAQVGGDLFFPDKGELSKGKTICSECPVTAQCLQYALDMNISTGIYGGTSAKQRSVMKRKMRRAA